MQTISYPKLSLIVSNLIPVYGVMFLGWNLSAILFLYWFENIVIGIYNVLRMSRAEGLSMGDVTVSTFKLPYRKTGNKSLMFFFSLHYGLFTFVHGVFLFTLFIRDLTIDSSLVFAIIGLFISHGISYSVNFLGKGEYKHISANDLMLAPYKRIIIMQITILFGAAFVTTTTGNRLPILLVLVGLKTILDLISHSAEHGLISVNVKPRTHSLVTKIQSFSGIDENIRHAYEESVRTGEWEKIKKTLDPETAENIEKYFSETVQKKS